MIKYAWIVRICDMMLDSDYAPIFVLTDVGLYMLLAELMLKFFCIVVVCESFR